MLLKQMKEMASQSGCCPLVSYISVQTNCRVSLASGPQSHPLLTAVKQEYQVCTIHCKTLVTVDCFDKSTLTSATYQTTAWLSYLVMYLLLTECHQDDRDEEIKHHKGHEHNAGADEESTKHRVVVQNLKGQQIEIP